VSNLLLIRLAGVVGVVNDLFRLGGLRHVLALVLCLGFRLRSI
jgi:hypothetical protein